MNNEPELSAEARRVIAAANGYDDPSLEERERVKTRWLATVAAAASVSTLGEVARAASTSGWGAKAVGWVLALAAGAAGVFSLLPEKPSPAPVARVEQQASKGAPVPRDIETAPEPVAAPAAIPPAPAAVPPATVPPEAVLPAPVVESETTAKQIEPILPAPSRAPVKPALARRPASEPVAATEPVQVESSAPAPVAAPEEAAEPAPLEPQAAAPALDTSVQSRQLGEETLLLSKIRQSLRRGATARALDELAEYRQRFEKPLLGMEAAALRVDALCRSGNVEAGRAEAELFHATWPSSPLEQRVRASCP